MRFRTYFLFSKSLSLWKIGRSKRVEQRMAVLKKEAKDAVLVLVLSEDRCSELMAHRKFSQFRSHGEWFKDCEKIRSFVKRNLEFDISKKPTGQVCIPVWITLERRDALKRLSQKEGRNMGQQIAFMIQPKLDNHSKISLP